MLSYFLSRTLSGRDSLQVVLRGLLDRRELLHVLKT
jgi:hypothetical protein